MTVHCNHDHDALGGGSIDFERRQGFHAGLFAVYGYAGEAHGLAGERHSRRQGSNRRCQRLMRKAGAVQHVADDGARKAA